MKSSLNTTTESIFIIIILLITVVIGFLGVVPVFRLCMPFAVISIFIKLLSLFRKNKYQIEKECSTEESNKDKIKKYVYGSLFAAFFGSFWCIPCLFGIYLLLKAKIIMPQEDKISKRIKFYYHLGYILNIFTFFISISIYSIILFEIPILYYIGIVYDVIVKNIWVQA